MHDEAETVSIVIPAYNAEAFVGEAVESALAQFYPSVEVIVVDDGSTDGTGRALETFGGRIEAVTQRNQGTSSARNTGARIARGRWVVFLDADDRLDPMYVQRCLEHLQAHPHADFVYTQMRFFGEMSGVTAFPEFSAERLVRDNFIHASALLPRMLVQRHPFNEKELTLEDWEFYLNALREGARGSLLDEPLLEYRRHSHSKQQQAARFAVRLPLAKLRVHMRHCDLLGKAAPATLAVDLWHVLAGALQGLRTAMSLSVRKCLRPLAARTSLRSDTQLSRIEQTSDAQDMEARPPLGQVVWCRAVPTWGEATAYPWPSVVGPPLQGALGHAVRTCLLHPVAVGRSLGAGVSPPSILKAALLRPSAAVLGITQLLTPTGAPEPVSSMLPAPRRPRGDWPGVSVAMIVQDEAHRLPQALESVLNFASEILVVDGGSQDDTINIAKSYGARVHQVAFTGDFSKQRNISLALTAQPWVLVLDADETVEPELAILIQDLLPRIKRARVVFLPRLNVLDEKPADPWAWPDLQARLFRRELRYVGKVHEQIDWRGASVVLPVTGPYLRHRKSLREHYRDELRYEGLEPHVYAEGYIQHIRAVLGDDPSDSSGQTT